VFNPSPSVVLSAHNGIKSRLGFSFFGLLAHGALSRRWVPTSVATPDLTLSCSGKGLQEAAAACRRRAFSDPPRVRLCLGHSLATVDVTPGRRLQLSPCWIWWRRTPRSHRRSLVFLSVGHLRALPREGSTAAPPPCLVPPPSPLSPVTTGKRKNGG
jgi:hypothetical protein